MKHLGIFSLFSTVVIANNISSTTTCDASPSQIFGRSPRKVRRWDVSTEDSPPVPGAVYVCDSANFEGNCRYLGEHQKEGWELNDCHERDDGMTLGSMEPAPCKSSSSPV